MENGHTPCPSDGHPFVYLSLIYIKRHDYQAAKMIAATTGKRYRDGINLVRDPP
jgi:hypothetical protein